MNTNYIDIRQPKSHFMLYIIFVAFFFSSTVLFILLEDGITEMFFILLPWLSVFLLLAISNRRWKLTVKDNQITHTPFFGKTKSFTFSDITRIERGIEHLHYEDYEYIKAYRENEKLFYVKNCCKGFDALALRMESTRRTTL